MEDILRQALRQCLPDCQASDGDLNGPADEVFNSSEARAIKDEIVAAGKKLWLREYVDGNGGNISCRISRDHVICTPTLRSKGDLSIHDLALVSLTNERLLGALLHTSELLLHLEIYNAVPSAKAVIHCHPPHATAYAITGLVPPGNVTPEQEVFVGPVALSPYETPGTKAFAETVLPYVRNHNTILLANHGLVCWADTVTHAEWLVEVMDAYCRTLILASSLGAPIRNIPQEQIVNLLQIKKRLGLPDARFEPAAPASVPEASGEPVTESASSGEGERVWNNEEAFEALVASIAEQVMAFANGGE
ncbi:MAG TPA: class II aldolase/adducin family protein [Terriglobia bacterium]|nr:class II aldolase/adducin family protein [Terriglobia bacterium]